MDPGGTGIGRNGVLDPVRNRQKGGEMLPGGKKMREVINNTTGEIVELDDKVAETRALTTVQVNKLISDEVLEKLYMLQALKEAEETLRYELLPILRAYNEATGEKTYKHEYVDLTYKKGFFRENFDAKRFKADYPDLYKEYSSQSAVKESVSIKVK